MYRWRMVMYSVRSHCTAPQPLGQGPLGLCGRRGLYYSMDRSFGQTPTASVGLWLGPGGPCVVLVWALGGGGYPNTSDLPSSVGLSLLYLCSPGSQLYGQGGCWGLWRVVEDCGGVRDGPVRCTTAWHCPPSPSHSRDRPVVAHSTACRQVPGSWVVSLPVSPESSAVAKPQCTMYWDGSCELCKLEVGHYQSIRQDDVRFVDISQLSDADLQVCARLPDPPESTCPRRSRASCSASGAAWPRQGHRHVSAARKNEGRQSGDGCCCIY